MAKKQPVEKSLEAQSPKKGATKVDVPTKRKAVPTKSKAEAKGTVTAEKVGVKELDPPKKHSAVSAADLLGIAPAPRPARTRPKTKGKIPKANAEKWAEHLRRLEEMRDRIERSMNHIVADHIKESNEGNASTQGGMDEGDVGSRSSDQDVALGLVNNSQELLHEVEDAIQRIRDGEYGACEICEEEIPSARLDALPYARMCVRCKSLRERRPSAMTASRRSSIELPPD